MKLAKSSHFDALVSLENSSVHVVAEVFDCGKAPLTFQNITFKLLYLLYKTYLLSFSDERVVDALYFTEALLSTFKANYAQDASISFQYFCSAKGFLRHYPGRY